MNINYKKLIRLPVRTESGAYLGRVRDIDLDTESLLVRHLLVRLSAWGGAILLIAPAQIVTISDKAVIVDNGVRASDSEMAAVGSVLSI